MCKPKGIPHYNYSRSHNVEYFTIQEDTSDWLMPTQEEYRIT